MKLFAWDFHGTLEQGTEIGFAHLLSDLAKSINYPIKVELEEVRKLYGISILDYLKHYFPKLSNEELVKLREKIRTIQNIKHIARFIKPAPYAELVLGKIKKAGHKNIIVSTSSQKHIGRFLKVVKLHKYIDEVFGIDRHSLDGEFNIAEEKSKAIIAYAEKFNIDKPRITVIGDREGDVNAGLMIGAKTYQYINPDFPKIKTNADYKIRDLRKILKEI